MKYRIIGTTIPAVEIKFDAPGETMYTQSGGMSWMSEGISMSTNTRGGFMKGLGRMFAGESMFMATYRADAPGATIAFASTVPGQVLPIDAAENGGMICQKGAFLCAQDSVNLDVTFTKKFTSGLFGGEGFIMQKLSGNVIAFIEIDGHATEYELSAGQELLVSTGYLAAMEESCTMDVVTVKGAKNMLLGGEGIFNTVVKGPGKVILQTMPISKVAELLMPFFSNKK